MEWLYSVCHWLTGGEHQYMRLKGCMMNDWFWITATVALDLLVAAGYVVIASHWRKNERLLPDVPAKRALGHIRNIFLFCGICGYLFIPIKMVWPARRLYDFFMIVLVYYTWRYAWSARGLKVIYSEIGRSTRLAADLQRSQQEAREKSFFLNAISHDLRTPLNGLMLQANLAEVGIESNDPQILRQAIHEMKTSACAAGRLLDSLLNYAQLAAININDSLTTFRLSDAADSVMEQHRAQASGKGLSLRCQISADLHIRSNRPKLERILSNLIDNGIKYTQTGGVRLEADTNGKGIELHVSDTGIGIAPEHRDKLFEEFYQIGNEARDHQKGFGLGLAIARRLATQLGGDLVVESAPGRGSRFSILLPGVVARSIEPAGAAAVAVGS